MPKKNILAIFAHPDDESFAVGGTLAKLSQDFNVYLVCATDGNDSTSDDELGEVRRGELEAAAAELGLQDVFFLGYKDGGLCNSVYHEAVAKIQSIVDELMPFRLITFEPRGGSGHLDHVAVSMFSSYVFERNDFIEEIWYYCISKAMSDQMEDYFIYFPDGFEASEVDLVMDVADVWDTKVAAMKKHNSQLKDVNNILQRSQEIKKEELFQVKRK